jgi:hypothetical protein
MWFSITVPPSGKVVISTSALQITDGAFSVYTINNNCLDLNELVCVDDAQGSLMPEVYLSGLTFGDTLLIRFWGYGGSINNQVGTFGICVTNPICTDPTIDGTASAC